MAKNDSNKGKPQSGGPASGPHSGGPSSGPHSGGLLSAANSGGPLSGPHSGGPPVGPHSGGPPVGPHSGGPPVGPHSAVAPGGPSLAGAPSGPGFGSSATEAASSLMALDSASSSPSPSKGAATVSQTTNQAGLQLIESFEGLRLTSYQDSVGVWTIGYGHTLGVKAGQTITQQQAQAFLQQDLGVAEAAVNRLGLNLTGNQFAALVSFTFNLGGGNLNKLMKNGLAAVPDRILLFDHAGGKVLPGLTRRRQAERALYLTPDPTN